MADEYKFDSIPDAIEDIKAGKFVVVVDDEDRENEGDLIMAADKITPEAVNFLAKYGRGLVCVCMTGERIEKLKLHASSRVPVTPRPRLTWPVWPV